MESGRKSNTKNFFFSLFFEDEATAALVLQLRLQLLDLHRQVLHLLRLRGDRLGLLRDQVLNGIDLALDGVGGHGGRRLRGGRVGVGGGCGLLSGVRGLLGGQSDVS